MKSRSEPHRPWLLDPLSGPIAPEVPLPEAPLVRVIAQVKFPVVASILNAEFIAPFQEAIRKTYTDLSRIDIQDTAIAARSDAIAVQRAVGPWRFQTPGDGWLVSLAPDFVAVEATAYTSRSDFLNRLRQILEALRDHVGPRTVDRLGIRYVDRLTESCLPDLSTLVRPEVVGVTAHPQLGRLALSITESTFALEEGQLTARWGLVPANATYDPSAIEPNPAQSWVLDLDMYRLESRPFAVEDLLSESRNFSERIYTVFRWTVTEAFLERFGGNV
jgi:uncharacterized protein (TIGR04255 family)